MKSKFFNLNILSIENSLKIANFKLIILGIFLLLTGLTIKLPEQVYAASTYPISSLGNCRDAKECKLYCDVPAHTPACWSYDKYVLNKDVLGDETANITYPITDLGNCANAQECFIYCNQPANQPACLSYARKSGLVKEETTTTTNEKELVESARTELGCTSKDTCMALCSDPTNLDKCRTFAQSHGLDKGEKRPPPEILTNAKTDLGCESETSCMNFCQKPENQSKCFEFAKKNGLMKEEDVKKMEDKMEQKKQMVEAAKTELGCDSSETCGKICEDPANRDKCMNMGKKFGMIKEEAKSATNNNVTQKPTLPCTSETECKKYCVSHPDECPGMAGRPNTNASDTSLSKPTTVSTQKGDFVGPSGCKTEDECKAFCEKHPGECPGFPKVKNPEVKPVSTTQTYITPSTTEFPADCSKNAECRARFCAKYPARCTAINQNTNNTTSNYSGNITGVISPSPIVQ